MSKVIRLIVSTHQGKLFEEDCDYVLIKTKGNEFGILPNHVATITSFEYGFIKFVLDKKELFLCLVSTVIEFKDNTLTVLAQEAHIGADIESAAKFLEEIRLERLEKNRQIDCDLATSERELAENIINAHAGNL